MKEGSRPGRPLRARQRWALFFLASIVASVPVYAADIIVTTTADSGPGSLRQAILDANASPGSDIIRFAIPGSGVHTIAPLSALPVITELLGIDGSSQPGFLCCPPGLPLIEISGALAPVGTDGLSATAQVSIGNLVINRFQPDGGGAGGSGIALDQAGSSLIQECLIGTDPTGTAALGNGTGISMSNCSSTEIMFCLISGNQVGVAFSGAISSQYNEVFSCKIGTDITGAFAVGNTGDGVTFSGGFSNEVSSSLISGNAGNGVSVFGTARNAAVTDCRIGVNADGTAVLSNGLNGVSISGVDVMFTVVGSFNAAAPISLISGNLGDGIRIANGAEATEIKSVWIGLDATGNVPFGNGGNGITLMNASDGRIGGPEPEERVVISGNGANGIELQSGSSNNLVLGNWIGTNASGSAAVGNGADGVRISGGSSGNEIAGIFSTSVVGGNTLNGIRISDPTTTGNTVSGMFVGVAPDGSSSLPNGANGVLIENGASGNLIVSSPAMNAIGFNAGAGVLISSGTGNRVANTRIFGNAGLGIDLAPLGVTPNDADDSDTGANQLQNFPIVTSASAASGQTHVLGSLMSAASATFHVEFFANPSCDPSGNGEGMFVLGSADVMTDATGVAVIDMILPLPAMGPFITATATDPGGNTSEFSPCVMLPGPVLTTVSPTSGPASGGTPISLAGMGFQSTVTVAIGGVAATSPVGVDDTHATAVTPALPPGALYDVVLTNTDGLSATLPKGWLADFTDVPGSHPFHAFVEKLFRKSVTAGCGLGNYCVNDPVTRAQVAVLLLRSHDGPTYVPPPATGTVFGDVPANGFAAAWIEELASRSVTAGCGGGDYCPTTPITRAQMSVFLLRMEHGAAYVPPDATGLFGDVPVTSPFARWVEQLVHEGVTAGCGGGNFCPDDPNTRGQMAVFLVTTFGL